MYCIFLLRSCLLRHDFLALVTLWYADFSSIYGHGGSWVSGDMARQRTSALVTVCDTLDILVFGILTVCCLGQRC
jgi:hypothetical protein